MPITVEDYIHYQAKEHTNRQTDPLDAILEHIKINPQPYSNKTTKNNNNDSQTYMMNNKQKTIHKEIRRNACKNF